MPSENDPYAGIEANARKRLGGSSRRDMLKLVGGGSMALLAGCSDGGGGSGPQTETATPPDSTDRTFIMTEYNDPKSNNYNPYDNLYYPTHSPDYIMGTTFAFNFRDRSVMPELAKKLNGVELPPEGATGTELEKTYEGTTVTIDLREGFTWHDGEPVTAQDVLTKLRLDKLMDKENFQTVLTSARALDDYKVELELQSDHINPDRITSNSFVEVNTPYHKYKQFLPKGEADSFDHEPNPGKRAVLQGKLLEHTVRDGSSGSAQTIGWGPWQLDEITDRNVNLSLYEDHPYADRINFPRIKFKWFSTNQAKFQNMIAGNFDGVHAKPTQTVKDQLPSKYREYRYNRRLGMGMAMNYKAESDPDLFKDYRVRQAFAYALDKPTIVKNSGLADSITDVHKFDSSFMSGEEAHKRYFGDDILDVLTQYDQDTEKAADLLEQAGWKKQNGKWVDDTGETVSLVWKVPTTWPDWINMAQTAVSQLQDFGIQAEFKTKELVVYYGKTMIQATYDIAGYYVGGALQYPYAALDFVWNGNNTITENHNHPAEYEVPMPVGDTQGSLETVNIQETLDAIEQNDDPEKLRELYRKAVWTYNQMMPVYCFNENYGAYYLDTDGWIGPPKDDPDAQTFWPSLRMMHEGRIRSRANWR